MLMIRYVAHVRPSTLSFHWKTQDEVHFLVSSTVLDRVVNSGCTQRLQPVSWCINPVRLGFTVKRPLMSPVLIVQTDPPVLLSSHDRPVSPIPAYRLLISLSLIFCRQASCISPPLKTRPSQDRSVYVCVWMRLCVCVCVCGWVCVCCDSLRSKSCGSAVASLVLMVVLCWLICCDQSSARCPLAVGRHTISGSPAGIKNPIPTPLGFNANNSIIGLWVIISYDGLVLSEHLSCLHGCKKHATGVPSYYCQTLQRSPYLV